MKNRPPSFVFIAHWVETWNWLLWWLPDLHRNPDHAWRWLWLYPVYFLASVFYLLGGKAYDVVDQFFFKGIPGQTILIRNFGWHFFLKSFRERIRQRLCQAVLEAQESGASVIGLGALTKAEWLTTGGKWLADELGNKLQVPIVHGDTLTAATVIHQALELIEKFGLEGKSVFITGATSKIGRAVSLSLAARGFRVTLFTESCERFNEIRIEAGKSGHLIDRATDFFSGQNSPLWITGKAERGTGGKLIKVLPLGAVVLNFSVPDPLSPRLLRGRPDVHHFDGGLLAYDSNQTDLRFTMRLCPGLTYACHAGTMVHAFQSWTHHEVGQVELDQLDDVWHKSQELGFSLPKPTSFLKLALHKKVS